MPARKLTSLPPALIVDIGETLLDNVPLNARDIINNQVYSYDRWNTWVEQAQGSGVCRVPWRSDGQAKRDLYYLTNRRTPARSRPQNLRCAAFR